MKRLCAGFGGGAAFAALVACASSPPLHQQYDPGQAVSPEEAADAGAVSLAPPTGSTSTQKLCDPQLTAPVDGGAPVEIGARHVLIQWMGCRRAPETVVRTREQALAVAEQVLKKARAGEDLGRLANEYSDEPMAGSRAGSLGCFRRGTMDKRFEAAAFALKPGDISDVVETDFGFHVIQRTE
jgi:hypothetical protein